MASLDWGGKTHGSPNREKNNPKIHRGEKSRGKGILTHCDKEHRQDPEHNHRNKHIDPSLSYLNQNFTGLTLEESLSKWDKRLKELDKKPGANTRSDAVILHCLEMPAPEGMSDEDAKKFFQDFYDMCKERFGEENIVAANSHFDEIHKYTDPLTGEKVRSRPHIQIQVVPEVNGRLCDKEFASRENIIWWNNALEKLCREKYHVHFNSDGPVRMKSVEQLKAETQYVDDLTRENEKMRDYLEKIHIRDDLTALEDFELGGTGTAVNSRDRKEIQDLKDDNRDKTDRLADIQNENLMLKQELKKYKERDEKIKRGIRRSKTPELTERTYNELVSSLESAGEIEGQELDRTDS